MNIRRDKFSTVQFSQRNQIKKRNLTFNMRTQNILLIRKEKDNTGTKKKI